MKKIKCIILDDEPYAVALLKTYASKINQIELLLATTDVYEVVACLQSEKVDLIFVDIQMPELTGMQVMQMFNKDNYFIVTTAYMDYALESYEYRVIDYLLKPISFDKFHKAFRKFLEFAPQSNEDSLFVKVDGKQVKLTIDAIVYIEGMSDYIKIHLKNERLVVWDNLKDFIKRLPVNDFMRVHKSYIIHLKKIKFIEGNLIYHELGTTPIGETYKAVMKNWIESN